MKRLALVVVVLCASTFALGGRGYADPAVTCTVRSIAPPSFVCTGVSAAGNDVNEIDVYFPDSDEYIAAQSQTSAVTSGDVFDTDLLDGDWEVEYGTYASTHGRVWVYTNTAPYEFTYDDAVTGSSAGWQGLWADAFGLIGWFEQLVFGSLFVLAEIVLAITVALRWVLKAQLVSR